MLKKIYKLLFRSWMPSINDHAKDQISFIYTNSESKVKFIQIGSNDGKSGDPLYDYIINNEVEGVLIEPVNYLFEELKNNYSKVKGVYFENIAISNVNDFCDFYVVEKNNNNNLPSWYSQLSSFDIKTILKHKNEIPEIENLIVKKKLPTKTLNFIVEKYNLIDLDILHIDTEGFDFEIIKTIDFKKLTPKLLIFEHKHLSLSDYKKSILLLKKYIPQLRELQKEILFVFTPKMNKLVSLIFISDKI